MTSSPRNRPRKAYPFSGAGMLSFLILAVVCSRLAAHEFGDDVGDGSETSESIAVDASPVTRTLEIDPDEDWYRFPVRPFVTYTVTVSKVGTVFDSALAAYEKSAHLPVAETNTVAAQSGASVSLTHTGSLSHAFARVSGMFMFATGDYSIAVSSGVVDIDLDGLPDPWEISALGSLAYTADQDPDGDGMTNRDEWLLQTSPLDPASVFSITGAGVSNDSVVVTWRSSPGGIYRIQAKTNLLDLAGWRDVATNVDSEAAIRMTTGGSVSTATARFYRVVRDE